MNPRQRRGLLLLVLVGPRPRWPCSCSIAVATSPTSAPRSTRRSQLLALAKPVEGATRRSPTTSSRRSTMPRALGAADRRCATRAQLVGLVAGTDLSRGLAAAGGHARRRRRELAPGQREVAILVDAETGVAGKIGPDSIVDVIATYAGDSQHGTGQPRVARRSCRTRASSTSASRASQGGRGVQEARRPTRRRSCRSRSRSRPKEAAASSPTRETFAAEVRLALLRPGPTRTRRR